MTTTGLRLSKDRKVANGVTANGKQAAMANTFGLPGGAVYSCPGMTEVCGSICYAGNLERAFPSVKGVLLHNWNLLKDADFGTMVTLIDDMITTFETQSDKRGLPKLFRIAWDGDMFSPHYTNAWLYVIKRHADTHFWVYTRVAQSAVMIHKSGLTNVSLYFSADRVNAPVAAMLWKTYRIRIAYLGETFQAGTAALREITGRPAARCPEQTGQISLISTDGSACVRCGLCVFGKANIVFSASKR
jgi:hypothetical protein